MFNEKNSRNLKLVTYQTMTDKCNKNGGCQPGARIEQVVSHGCR